MLKIKKLLYKITLKRLEHFGYGLVNHEYNSYIFYKFIQENNLTNAIQIYKINNRVFVKSYSKDSYNNIKAYPIKDKLIFILWVATHALFNLQEE